MDYEKGVAYIPIDKQLVKVYQIVENKEVLVKRFAKHAKVAAQNVEIAFSGVKSVIPTSTTDTSITISSLTPGTQHAMVVETTNRAGLTSVSDAIIASTIAVAVINHTYWCLLI